MKRFVQGKDRSQATLFPEVLDDYISAENPVRVVDVFINELDLVELGFEGAIPCRTGRPAYHPSTLLKIYVYGYLNRIQSSRRLERETQRNVELMWLTGRLSPDFKTIADFRKNNAQGIKNVCRTLVDVCRELNLFSEAIVAIDGSKFKAVNSKNNHYNPKKIQFHIERVERHIQEYLSQLDRMDQEEASDDKTSIEEKISELKSTIAKLKEMEKSVNASPDKQISATDPDSRLMKTNAGTRQVSYNLQSAVDTKNHLIVAHEVTNSCTDRGLLCSTGKLAQSALNNSEITVLADKGYYSSLDIKDAMDNGMNPLVPKGDTSGSEKKGIFNRTEFKYDASKDVYVCPGKEQLSKIATTVERGLTLYKYSSKPSVCDQCKLKPKCTTGKAPRRVTRWEHQHLLEQMDTKLKNNPGTAIIRKQTVEHPFGTIKSWMGSTHFLTKGLSKVSIEMNLHVLAYNLKRLMGIFGNKALVRILLT